MFFFSRKYDFRIIKISDDVPMTILSLYGGMLASVSLTLDMLIRHNI